MAQTKIRTGQATIDHVDLANKGTNTHAQIDSFITSRSVWAGVNSYPTGSSKWYQIAEFNWQYQYELMLSLLYFQTYNPFSGLVTLQQVSIKIYQQSVPSATPQSARDPVVGIYSGLSSGTFIPVTMVLTTNNTSGLKVMKVFAYQPYDYVSFFMTEISGNNMLLHTVADGVATLPAGNQYPLIEQIFYGPSGGVNIGGSADVADNNLYITGDCSALTFTDRP